MIISNFTLIITNYRYNYKIQACNINTEQPEELTDGENEDGDDIGQDTDTDPINGRIVMSSDTVGAPNICFSVSE